MNRKLLQAMNSGGGGSDSLNNGLAFWAPLNDLGAGTVNLVLTRGVGTATFTRASTAWTKLSTGLWTSISSGTPRSCYLGTSTAVGSYGGYFSEEARTNLCLQSRDLSNASWIKTTATAAKDQIGIDGISNSASSLTATADGGSCLQVITEAATQSALGIFIKRISGTGTITIQQGATTSDVTGQVNSSTYNRVSLVASILNPAIGITLGTNGDKIAVDMVDFQNGGFSTSPIPTTTTSQTRAVDTLNFPLTGNISNTVGTIYCEFSKVLSTYVTSSRLVGSTGASNNGLFLASTPSVNIFDGTNTTSKSITSGGTDKLVGVWEGNRLNVGANGSLGVAGPFDGDLGLLTSLAIGYSGSSVNLINGCVQNAKIWVRPLNDLELIGIMS